ncbi:MAG: aspartate aminotransferase family protein [Truepera sp.]|nr:aspartate aminotransferase family protein [Truepera sp.]
MVQTTSHTAALLKRQQQVLLPAQNRMLYYGDQPLAVAKAKDQYLWDVEGNRYLDFFGGILTVSIGHCNDEVVEATVKQLQTVGHTSTLYLNEVTIKVAEKIAAITPGRLQYSFFTNSGTEADELAVLAARIYTGNTDIIALRHAYSGRSLSMMSMTAHAPWRLGNVFDGAIKHVRSPYYYRAPVAMSEADFLELCVRDLEELITTCTNGRIAAFMAEPIQGVGGFVVAPQDYFKRILPLVKQAGGLLIIDEVQTGWGRTGRYWCGIEHWGVEPDIITFAKGIANGMPVGCTVMTPEVAEAVKGLTLSTFGGNPVAMASAYATISYIEKRRLWENAEVQGARLRERLLAMQASHQFIGDVRGLGLMQGLELVVPGGKTPDATRAMALLAAARRRGLLIGRGGLYGNVIRIAPHLNVSSADIEAGCELLMLALADVAG